MKYQDNIKEHLLVDIHKLLIPLVDVGAAVPRFVIIFIGCRRIMLMILAPLENFLEDGIVDLKLTNKLLAYADRNNHDDSDIDGCCRDY